MRKFVGKKIVFMLCEVFILSMIFTSCETLNLMVDKISTVLDGVTKGQKSDSDKSGSGGKSKTAFYKTPESYELAYSYRTDKADKTIQTFIKSNKIDSLRTTDQNEYVKNIAAKINEVAVNDFERVKMAHDAVCLLVSYDAKNFWANTIPDQSWQNVLKTKTAVCEGYANLFLRYMNELEVSAQKVSGYARGVGTDISSENPMDSNHAWNIVKIDDCWYLVDCTWDSGYMNGKKSEQKYNTEWLFLKPEHFVYTHFPDDGKNQLIQPPLSVTEFSSLPDFRPKLFELTGEDFSSVKKINNVDSCFVKEYKVKDDWILTYQVNAIGGTVVNNAVWTEKKDGIIKTEMQFPSSGSYKVTVYYMKQGGRSGQSCGQFLVEASEASSIKYPNVYTVKSKNTVLITPKQMTLIAGEKIFFNVYSEDKAFVAVIAGNKFIQLENDGNGNFTGEVEIPKNVKQISIGLSANGKGNYETLATFMVK